MARVARRVAVYEIDSEWANRFSFLMSNSSAIALQLNPAEYEIVSRQDAATKDDGGYQRLMVTLQEITDETTLVMVLPRHLIPRLQRYAFTYGQGGWEDRITGIFSRHLGYDLDREIP